MTMCTYGGILTSDTKVTFDVFFIRFDVVFTSLLHFAMCFVLTDCPVLCFLLPY